MVRSPEKRKQAKRPGIIDVWNAFMVEGASFDERDVPFCPTTANSYPRKLISWPEAKRLHNKKMKRGDNGYHFDAFIHFYIDDIKFDGPKSSVWLFPWKAVEIIRHFDGVITPDFSLCQDFPEPLKLSAVYRMRAFGYWLGSRGVAVINNVRWGTKETWSYCFAGIQSHTVVAIGTVASGLRNAANKALFEEGLIELIERLKPTAIIVYGSANYEFFKALAQRGIEVIQFDSEASQAHARGARHE